MVDGGRLTRVADVALERGEVPDRRGHGYRRQQVGASQVALAIRAGDRGRLVTAFREHAEALLTGTHRS